MEFQGFPKMPRLSREVIISEKLDGTNAQGMAYGGGLGGLGAICR